MPGLFCRPWPPLQDQLKKDTLPKVVKDGQKNPIRMCLIFLCWIYATFLCDIEPFKGSMFQCWNVKERNPSTWHIGAIRKMCIFLCACLLLQETYHTSLDHFFLGWCWHQFLKSRRCSTKRRLLREPPAKSGSASNFVKCLVRMGRMGVEKPYLPVGFVWKKVLQKVCACLLV